MKTNMSSIYNSINEPEIEWNYALTGLYLHFRQQFSFIKGRWICPIQLIYTFKLHQLY